MLRHSDINDKELLASIRKRLILVGGNRILKIYGTLHCSSGKRMKKQSRIFFKSEIEAKRLGYRPCGICMSKAYKIWKNEAISNKYINLLSFDGIVEYYGQLFSKGDADDYYQTLLDKIEWQNDEAIMFGKRIITKRKVAWYGDRPFEYKYSKITKTALPWTIELIQLKNKIQSPSKAKFNSCLLNLYHDGSEGMAWHSDDEKDLQKNGCIGSLTFGAERKFCFKHKVSGEVVSIILEHGSLLLMKGTTQTHWRHRLPPTKLIHSPRINLTFRTILE